MDDYRSNTQLAPKNSFSDLYPHHWSLSVDNTNGRGIYTILYKNFNIGQHWNSLEEISLILKI